MSETLTKLGGYVVNGQPELTTDNTLSGTGLPDSPLGVNETVLFSATNGQVGGNVALSESPFNFNRIGVTYQNEATSSNNYQGINYREYNMNAIQNMSGTPFLTFDSIGMDGTNGTAYQIIRLTQYSANSTGLVFIAGNQTLNFGTRDSFTGTKFYSVIGINRKQEA